MTVFSIGNFFVWMRVLWSNSTISGITLAKTSYNTCSSPISCIIMAFASLNCRHSSSSGGWKSGFTFTWKIKYILMTDVTIRSSFLRLIYLQLLSLPSLQLRRINTIQLNWIPKWQYDSLFANPKQGMPRPMRLSIKIENTLGNNLSENFKHAHKLLGLSSKECVEMKKESENEVIRQ